MMAPASRRGFLGRLTALPLIGGATVPAIAQSVPVASRYGHGCVILDRPVLFDAGRKPAIGEPVLVVLHDGTMAVFPAGNAYGAADPGHVYVEDKAPPRGCSRAFSHVGLVGTVIGEGAPCA